MMIGYTSKKNRGHTLVFILSACMLLITADAQATSANQQKMLDQLNQLDQLDHQDFVEASNKAYSCIYAHDFACADRKLAEAIEFATNAEDKDEVEVIRSKLSSERQIVAEEQRLKQQQERKIAAEQRRLEEAQREEEQRAMREIEANTPSTADQIALFGQLFLNEYAKSLESSRLAGERVRQLERERQAAYAESNARMQQGFARQREEIAEKNRNAEQTRNKQQADASRQLLVRQQQAEQERQAREQQRLAAVQKVEQERQAQAREQQRLAAEKVEQERQRNNTNQSVSARVATQTYPGYPKIVKSVWDASRLNKASTEEWCSKWTKRIRDDFASSRLVPKNELLSVGACTCELDSASVSNTVGFLERDYSCKFDYTFKQYAPTPGAR